MIFGLRSLSSATWTRADEELVAFRRRLFDEVHHHVIHYREAREIASMVPESTLRSSLDAVVTQHEVDWRKPLGL